MGAQQDASDSSEAPLSPHGERVVLNPREPLQMKFIPVILGHPMLSRSPSLPTPTLARASRGSGPRTGTERHGGSEQNTNCYWCYYSCILTQGSVPNGANPSLHWSALGRCEQPGLHHLLQLQMFWTCERCTCMLCALEGL